MYKDERENEHIGTEMANNNRNLRCYYKLGTKQVDATLASIVACIEYWNRTVQNPPQTSYQTEFATNLSTMSPYAFKDYLLKMVLSDCQVYVNEGAPYRVGLARQTRFHPVGSHVWVHSTEMDTRVLMIFVGGE